MSNRWDNRVVGTATIPVDDLRANPANWRLHPRAQRAALSSAIDAVGYLAPVIVNRPTMTVVDGHLRLEVARERNADLIPVTFVELTPEQEAVALATIDPITAMAQTDEDALTDLLAGIDREDADLAALLTLVEMTMLPQPDVEPEPVETLTEPDPQPDHAEHRCPSCGFTWNGDPD